MLDPVKIKAARRQEVNFVQEFRVYRKVPRANAIDGQFVTVKWVDVNIGDEQRPAYKSRLVARERHVWNSTLSGTSATTKMVLSSFMTETANQYKDVARKVEQSWEQRVPKDDDRVILILDVSRTFFSPRDQKNGLLRAPRRGQDRMRRSCGRVAEDDVWYARRKRRTGRLLLRSVRGR